MNEWVSWPVSNKSQGQTKSTIYVLTGELSTEWEKGWKRAVAGGSQPFLPGSEQISPVLGLHTSYSNEQTPSLLECFPGGSHSYSHAHKQLIKVFLRGILRNAIFFTLLHVSVFCYPSWIDYQDSWSAHPLTWFWFRCSWSATWKSRLRSGKQKIQISCLWSCSKFLERKTHSGLLGVS